MNAITYDTLRSFAYSNDKRCALPIRGIVLSFRGLGFHDMFEEDTDAGLRFAALGILYLIPYNNPWCWMNRQAVAYTDAIVDCVIRRYALPEDIPIVSTGGSMGGQSALVYMVYARRTPVACVANCPVCDLPYHYTERPDLPRTLCSAFFDVPGAPEQALRAASPLHLVDRMPDADYRIFHCEEDKAVNKARHSDRFVQALRARQAVAYHAVPGRGHCDLTDDMRALFDRYIIEAVEKGAR